VYAGRFVEKKRVGLLLEIWQQVAAAAPDARLLLVGKGPLEANLKEIAKRLGIESTVCFYGQTDRVAEILPASDIFVLPSVSEGLANALLEAMACGLPVLTTDTIGTRSVIEPPKEGLLFPEDDLGSLVTGLLTLLQDPALREDMGHNARIKIEKFFSVDRMAELYIRLGGLL
jgi:glycosyltransferase involved in cell wall biosynthesis